MTLKTTLDLVPVFVPRSLKDKLKEKAAARRVPLYRLAEQLLARSLADQGVVQAATEYAEKLATALQRIDELEATLSTAEAVIKTVPQAAHTILYPSSDTLLGRIQGALEGKKCQN